MSPNQIQSPVLDAALREWKTLLGEEWVDQEPSSLTMLEQATFAVSGRVLARLRPGTVEEVAQALRIAARHGVPVSVFSRGRNYGYSSNGPACGAGVALELSRLTAITEFDEQLGHVRVQAGVTFGQLVEFLRQRDSGRFLPATGGPPDGSVLANTVERGHGLGFGGDRYANSCRYEVVTARGERFETGFGRFEGSRIANIMRVGVGPSLDGLFTQSSLGVVTAATLWLPRRPRHWACLLVPSPSRERIGVLFDCVGEAARQGLVRDGAAAAFGGYKLASMLLRREDFKLPVAGSIPWEGLRQHSRRWGHSAWVLAVVVDADSPGVLTAKRRAAAALFRAHLGRGEHVVTLSAGRARLARLAARFLSGPIAGLVRQVVDTFHTRTPFVGYPVDDPLRTVYWPVSRNRDVRGRDLREDQVGLIWVSVPVPLRGSEITEVASVIDDGLLAHGFEPMTQVTLVSERLARVITALNYDRTNRALDEAAIRCQMDVYATLRRRGYYTYRLQPHLMDEYAAYGVAHQAVVTRLKRALDPRGVIDPGRYPGGPWPEGDERGSNG